MATARLTMPAPQTGADPEQIRSRPEQTGADQSRPEQTGADRSRPEQTGADRSRPEQTGADRSRPEQTGEDRCPAVGPGGIREGICSITLAELLSSSRFSFSFSCRRSRCCGGDITGLLGKVRADLLAPVMAGHQAHQAHQLSDGAGEGPDVAFHPHRRQEDGLEAADLIRALTALPVALPVVGGNWEPELRSRCCRGSGVGERGA